MKLISLFFMMIATENIILSKSLIDFSISDVINDEMKYVGMGIFTIFIVLISTIATYFINQFVLVPFDIQYLRTIITILIIAFLVFIVELMIKTKWKRLYKKLNLIFPFTISNCAVLGIILNNVNMGYNLLFVIVSSLGSCVGFLLVLYLLEINKERIKNNDIVKSFKGMPITLIMMGIMSLIFTRFV